MRKYLFFISFSALILSFLFVFPKPALAVDCTADYSPREILENEPFTVTVQNTTKDKVYHVFITDKVSSRRVDPSPDPKTASTDGQVLTFTIPGLSKGVYDINAKSFTIGDKECIKPTTIEVKSSGGETPACVIWFNSLNPGERPIIKQGETAALKALGNAISHGRYTIDITGSGRYTSGYTINSSSGIPILLFTVSTNKQDGTPMEVGDHVVSIFGQDGRTLLCTATFAVDTPGTPGSISPIPTDIPALLPCKEGLNEEGKVTEDKALIKKCTKIDSAIGPVETDPAEFIKKIFTVILSMAGGWAVYLIITAGYQLMFSGHEAEKVQEARDKITSAIVGLVFMILSLVVLRVIGVDIFQLPTFTK